MAKLDAKELEKLSPEARLKKLREIQEEDKKELSETEKLIQKALAELAPKPSMGGAPDEGIASKLKEEAEGLELQVKKESKPSEEDIPVKYERYDGDYNAVHEEGGPPALLPDVEASTKYRSVVTDVLKSTSSGHYRSAVKDALKSTSTKTKYTSG